MLIRESKIQEILERADIVEVIGRSVTLSPDGENFKGLCPVCPHSKSDHFVVSPERRRFKCFNSGWGGDVITFVMRQRRMGFEDAAVVLAAEAGIEL